MLNPKIIKIKWSPIHNCWAIDDEEKSFYVSFVKNKVKITVLYSMIWWNQKDNKLNEIIWDYIHCVTILEKPSNEDKL